MKIGTTVTFTDDTALQQAKRAGFQCIDAQGLVNPEEKLYSLSDEEFETAVQRARASVDAVGIEVSQLHGPWRWPAQDDTPAKREHWLTLCKRAIRACELLGCKHLVIHPLMPFGEEETDAALAKELNFAFFRSLCDVGEEHGVVICVENMPFGAQSLARVAPLLDFVREIDSPWLRVCLDTGHCACLGGLPAEAVRLLGEYLAVLHVHDNDGKGDRHWEPGLGIVDWENFMHALVEIGFDGVLSLEVGYRAWLSAEDKDAYLSHLAGIAKRLISYTE